MCVCVCVCVFARVSACVHTRVCLLSLAKAVEYWISVFRESFEMIRNCAFGYLKLHNIINVDMWQI